MKHSESSPDSQSQHITTFWCPDCDHQSAVGGDWIVHDVRPVGDRYHLAYECPACGSVLPEVVRLQRLSRVTP